MKTTNKTGKHYYDLRDRSHNLDSNTYYFPFYKKDSSVAWEETFFRGVLNGTVGTYIWSDGDNIYYSYSTKQYKLEGTVWKQVVWKGLSDFNAQNIWTDGENIYYSNDTEQYKLNGTTWEPMTWSGLTSFDGVNIWTDGVHIFYSYATVQYKLNGTTWEFVRWTGLDNVSNYLVGTQIWTDGNDIYFSWGEDQFRLDGTNWVAVTWSGYSDITGQHVWTDGTNIYFSYGTKQYALSEDSTTWRTISWTGITDFYGDCIWNDGKYLYYSYFTTQYRHRIANVKYKTTLEDLKNQMGGGGVVSGYYKEADGKFYEESTYETEIVGDEGMIYIDIPTNLSYWFDGTSFHVTGSMIEVDNNFSTTSENPVQNKVITNARNADADIQHRVGAYNLAKSVYVNTVISANQILLCVDTDEDLLDSCCYMLSCFFDKHGNTNEQQMMTNRNLFLHSVYSLSFSGYENFELYVRQGIIISRQNPDQYYPGYGWIIFKSVGTLIDTVSFDNVILYLDKYIATEAYPYIPYAKTNKVLTDGLNNVIITISKAEYDALSSSEKSDPSKVYYVYDDESDVGYYELEVTLSSAVASGGTIRIPASGTDSHMSDNCTVIPTSELKSNGKPYRYSSIAVNNGYVTITAGEDIPANTKMGVVIYN